MPPDYFSETGQRWGNPLYRWDRMRKTGYAWWIERFRATLAAFDAVRLDHFIGFARYWAIPGHEPTAINGRWRRGPGTHFFAAVRRALRGAALPLIAEDLGVVTPEVKALRDEFGLPGIKILQFAFGTDPNAPDFLPHNYPRNAVVYTGTHDNDTTAGWFHDPGSGTRSPDQTEKERRVALTYLGHAPESDVAARDIHWEMIRMAMMSVANVAIVPAQDLLGLGSESRMNRPGTDRGNWAFRLSPGALAPAVADRLRQLCETYDRLGGAALPRRAAGERGDAEAPDGARVTELAAPGVPDEKTFGNACAAARGGGGANPHWYKDAIIYEARVRSFYDSNSDGYGDFRGLASKLDYLQDLGVTAIWLLPFYPSPMRDDGYDIAEYTDVHHEVGTLADFEFFLEQAHAHGLRVITELVLNHTSDQHPWFKRARRAPPGSVESDFYVWSDTPERYREARIIFKDFEPSNWAWDPVARALLLAPLLRPPARSELREPGGARGAVRRRRLLVRQGRRRTTPRRRPLPVRGGGDQLRKPPRDAPVPEETARARGRAFFESHAARRSEPVARGRGRVFRRGRRVPHELPLSDHAADVHGDSHGGSVSDPRHPGADAADPGRTASGRCSCATTTS